MTAPSPACAHANALLLDLLYGELEGSARHEVETHVESCARCTAELAALRSTRQMMGTLEPLPAPEAGLESLLGYARQQAARAEQVAPVRPAWRRWLLGSIPVAAVALLGVSLALESSHSHPALSTATREERGLPSSPDEGAVMAAPPDQPAPPPAPPAEALAAKDAEPARKMVAAKKEAVAPGGYGAFPGHASLGTAGKPALGTAGLQKGVALRRSAAAPVAAVPPPSVLASRERSPSADLDGAASRKAPSVLKEAEEKADALGGAADSSVANAAPAPAAAPVMRSGRAAEAQAGALAEDDELAAAPRDDGLARAEALRRKGDHAGAADAYLAIYQQLRTGKRAERALFDAALEDRAAGRLARAAEEFERYASNFPRAEQAPTALAQAASILRSREGEGAATRLETDLLQRYPASREASGLRARFETPQAARKSERSSAPAPQAPAAQPAGPAQPMPSTDLSH